MSDSAGIRRAEHADMKACACILNAWIDDTDWMPRIHTADDVERYYQDTVFAQHRIWVALNGDSVAGFASLANDGTIMSLYVEGSARRRGLGKALINELKAACPKRLALWTMQANREAQQFYLREGFREIRRTDGDNEEGLPDILYEWKAADD